MPRWIDPKDLVAQGDPETVVELPAVHQRILGLCVAGMEHATIIGVRLDAQGVPLTCAVADVVRILQVPSQSNPRRVYDSRIDEDGS